MKKYRFLIVLLILFLPTTVFCDYELEREDIYDYKEFFEDLFPVESNQKSNACVDIGEVYAECTGVTVSGYGTYSLDEYVAGVLAAEMSYTIQNDELGKAYAIVVRSYTLAHTNNCKNSISSSSTEQNFSGTDHNTYRKYADETSGMVMANPDGSIVLAVYSLAPADDCEPTGDGMCKFRRCSVYADSVESCSGEVTEFIVPQGLITYQYHDVHYGGVEPFIGSYLALEKNYDYVQLLKAFYGNNISLAKLTSLGTTSNTTQSSSTKVSTSSSSKLVCEGTDGGLNSADAKGFRKRTAQPESSNKHFFSSENPVYGTDNVGQCTWYAYGRASEILETANSNLKMWGSFPNAGDWYSFNKSFGQNGFKSSTDVNAPKVGAIIVWTDNGTSSGCSGCGHVGIVESVNSDGTVDISEANISGIKSDSNPYGWQYVSNMNISDINYRWGGYTFIGYIYVVE